MTKTKKVIQRALSLLIALILFGSFAIWGLNGLVKVSMADRILSPEAAAIIEDADCILVLGCLVNEIDNDC